MRLTHGLFSIRSWKVPPLLSHERGGVLMPAPTLARRRAPLESVRDHRLRRPSLHAVPSALRQSSVALVRPPRDSGPNAHAQLRWIAAGNRGARRHGYPDCRPLWLGAAVSNVQTGALLAMAASDCRAIQGHAAAGPADGRVRVPAARRYGDLSPRSATDGTGTAAPHSSPESP